MEPPPPTSTLFAFFNDTATTEIYTLSLHDALPMWRRTEAPQIEIPGVILFLQPLPNHALAQDVQALLALAAADDFADPRHQHVHRRHRAAIVVQPHVEGLDQIGTVPCSESRR